MSLGLMVFIVVLFCLYIFFMLCLLSLLVLRLTVLAKEVVSFYLVKKKELIEQLQDELEDHSSITKH